jgi:hypothetical protein
MTRHDMLQPQAAGARSPATDPRVPMVISDADRAIISRLPSQQHSAEVQRSGLAASNLVPPGDAPPRLCGNACCCVVW